MHKCDSAHFTKNTSINTSSPFRYFCPCSCFWVPLYLVKTERTFSTSTPRCIMSVQLNNKCQFKLMQERVPGILSQNRGGTTSSYNNTINFLPQSFKRNF